MEKYLCRLLIKGAPVLLLTDENLIFYFFEKKPDTKKVSELATNFRAFVSFVGLNSKDYFMRFFTVMLVLLLATQGLFAQQQPPSRQELEKRRAALLREIQATQSELSVTKKDRKTSVSQLRALNSKLRARQNLINTINSELGNINGTIQSLGTEIQVLNKNLDRLKLNYAKSVRYAYMHRTSQNLILFLFSSANFNDAIRRMEYLKKYRDYRKKQADDIRKARVVINQKIAVLNSNRRDKAGLLQSEVTQKSEIQKEQAETNQMVQELKGREGDLMAQIRENQRIAGRIQNAIKAEIQREIRIAQEKAAEEARKKAEAVAREKAAEEAARKKADEIAKQKGGSSYRSGNQTVTLNTGTNSTAPSNNPVKTSPPAKKEIPNTKPNNVITDNNPNSYKLSLTPEVQALSNSFAANKGKLPWPVTNGFISSRYGRHPHPVYQNVMIDNNGIDIATTPNAPVRAVFNGTVIKVTNINGFVVMISHGEYFTVYSNLATVSVSAGMTVSTKQAIGTAGQNIDGENMVNFQIWKVSNNNSSSTVNPENWIAQ